MDGWRVLKKRWVGGKMKLFIFGSTGDLVKRKVLPALHKFENLETYVLGRKKLDNEEYNNEYCKKCSKEFKLKLNYLQVNFEEDIYFQLKEYVDKKNVNYFYISMPPEFTLNLIQGIINIRDSGFKVQILVEKPFGANLKEAKLLQKLVNIYKLEEDIYLSDHYLFKENLFSLNEINFNKLKLFSLEELGIEGRNYYDSVGALKDMIQSHFLNIMHRLMKFSYKDVEIKDAKIGQYKDYKKEIGRESDTETYVKIELEIKGRKIELETGKKFNKKESFIELDNIKTDISLDNECYYNLFESFFNKRKDKFPTIDNSITNWKIIEKIEKKKSEVFLY